MKHKGINLLKDRKLSTVDKVINWAFSAGRVIIIITEGVALAAFLYRFTLDSQIVDLHSRIKQKQAIITLYKDNEQTYRQLQTQLDRINQLAPLASNSVTSLGGILEKTPQSATVESATYSSNSVKLQMVFLSRDAIRQFISSLQTLPQVNTVSIDSIENKSTTGVIVVGISITLKNI